VIRNVWINHPSNPKTCGIKKMPKFFNGCTLQNQNLRHINLLCEHKLTIIRYALSYRIAGVSDEIR
jgi:hypothetical protein